MKSMTVVCWSLIVLLAPRAHAQVFGVDIGVAGAIDMNTILLASQPLSPLEYKEKTFTNSVQIGYYTGDSSFLVDRHEFDGYTASVFSSYAKTDRWGYYGSFNFNRYRTEVDFLPSGGEQEFLKDVKISFYTVGGGLHYKVYAQKEGSFWPSLILIGGPALKIVHYSQTVQRKTVSTDTLTVDFDMGDTELLPILMVGGQIGWKLGNFLLNPYAFLQLPLAGECRPYEVRKIRQGDFAETQGGNCDGFDFSGEGNGEMDFSAFQIAGGVHLHYLPWELSVNVTAPFIRLAIENDFEQDSKIFSITKSF
jgi:hypothetical protein